MLLFRYKISALLYTLLRGVTNEYAYLSSDKRGSLLYT